MRVSGFIRSIVGILISLVGYAMFLSPELTWSGLQDTVYKLYGNITNELIRLADDPIGIIGFIMILVGIWILMDGLKNFISGGSESQPPFFTPRM